jgi:uncharacterized protein
LTHDPERQAMRLDPRWRVRLGLALLSLLPGALHAAVALPSPESATVHDLAGIVRSEDAAEMEQLHAELFAQCGVALVVITVPSLDGEPIEVFAHRVAETWAPGRRGEDLGIVVALALAERRIQVATGYGVESFLPDGRVGRLIDRHALAPLRRDDFSSGLRQLSAALAGASADHFGVELSSGPRRPSQSKQPTRFVVLFIVLLLIGSVLVIVVVARALSRRGRAARVRRSGRLEGPDLRGGRGIRGARPSGHSVAGSRGGGFGGFGGGGFGGGGAGRGF